MAETEGLPHALKLDERKKLTVTGVTEVVSFDDTQVVLRTAPGTLIVRGQDLKLKQLVPEGGSVAVVGEVGSLVYDETRQTGSLLSRLFG